MRAAMTARAALLALLCAAATDAISIASNPTAVYSTVTSKLRIQGDGFGDGDGTNLHLTFVPAIKATAYSVQVTGEKAISVLLKSGKQWPLPAGLSESTLYVTEVRSDMNADPTANLLDEPKAVATVVATPTVVKRDDRLLYMSASLKLLVNGSHFRPKKTQFTFDPPLFAGVDYEMTVKNAETAQLSLKTGRKWRSDGLPGPLKLKRIDTGAGPLRIDAKFGGVTVAEVQANLGGHGVTVETTSDKKYYQSASEIKIIGHGFNETAPANALRWGNKLQGRGTNYTVTKASTNALTLSLIAGSKWRPNAANLPGPLTLLAVNAGAGLVPVGATEAKKGRVVATIYADPSLRSDASRTIYRTLTHEIWLLGGGFVRGSTTVALVGEAPGGEPLKLRPYVDYLLSVFNATHARVALRDGRAWATTPGGTLKCVGLDTGAGPAPTVTEQMPRVLGKVAADATHESGAMLTPTASTQTLYETPALKRLKITGTSLCAKGFNGDASKVDVAFAPPLAAGVARVAKASSSEITLALEKDKKWPVGVLYVASITCGDSVKRTFADGSGVGVATVLWDPIVEAHPELRLYGAHSKRLVVRGSGFSPDGTSLTLEPTPQSQYEVVDASEWSVTLELKGDGAWVDPAKLEGNAKGVALKVTKLDTGAGEVRFKDVVVATVVAEPDGDICDDSCEWANDGVCDDGTAPDQETYDQYRYGGFDDDWGGTYDDEPYYAGFYDDAYGELFDDYGALPACAEGTDCTDCQPLHGDASKTEVKTAECDNTCEFARDGFCDDSRTNGYCALGTDCQDCGPASAGNYSTYDDDEWWDDDEANWYWDDDYYDDDFDQRRFDDFYADDKKPKQDKTDDDGAVGYVRSTDPFATDDTDDSSGAALLVAALLLTAVALGACAACRIARGGRCKLRTKDGEKADLQTAWQEMTANPSAKKTNVPITPDHTFSGADGSHNA
mmetsp:Transcript_21649/g.66561  ORF Transcript_21649/g.66561 Transcript_21649/m.66561 type:complete len:957 (+) Transcript_21649:165-3035(+)